MNTEKIKIESHGLSPWHYFLENMSWGFSRKQKDDDIMAFLNVDPNLKNGGRGLEDVLMADFLQSLDFADRTFLNAILKAVNVPEMATNAEIRGNAGNYYIPYENPQKGVRLAQPDGWIADADTLILLEAKGYRKNASLNKGQLAKEILIAQNVAKNTGHKNFYVMLIVNKLENIYKSGKDKYNLSIDSFSTLWQKNVADLEDFLNGQKEMLREDKIPTDVDDVLPHFRWITWDEIARLADNQFKDNPCAQEIIKAIDFHSEKKDEQPVFSKMLAKLAVAEAPLYQFYNGGCGNEILQKYEEEFLGVIGKKDNPWSQWHKLAQDENAKKISDLSELEKTRREAAATLKQVSKKIREFYRKSWNESKAPKTTRKAFEILGESANLENKSNFFEQRMTIPEKTSSEDKKN